jgi:hypothetical protein
MCCGQKRRALTLAQNSAAKSSPSRSAQTEAGRSSANPVPEVSLFYLQQSPIQLRGLYSGRMYQFSPSHPIQFVDQRDASTFLRTPRLFRPTK